MRSLLRSLASLVVLVGLVGSQSGCYLGHSRGGKVVAYGANGAMIVAGADIMADSRHSGDEGQLVATIAAVPLIVGLVGIAINLATSTEPAPSPMPPAFPQTRTAATTPPVHVSLPGSSAVASTDRASLRMR